MTARILNVTPAQYHADPCATPSLSSSIAHVLVSKSPLHAYTAHPRLGGKDAAPEVATKPKNAGTIIHELLLGKGKGFVIIEADNYRTKIAQELRDTAIAAGRTPMLLREHEDYLRTASILRDRLANLGIDFSGESEVAIEWTDECADGPIQCRSMIDHLYRSAGALLDVKTCASANPRDIERHFVEFGYDIQWAAYTRALAALEPELQGRIDMVFIFVEIEPPFSTTIIEPDGAFREIGRLQWERAVQVWRECLATGYWPDYSQGAAPIRISPPPWVLKDQLGEEWR